MKPQKGSSLNGKPHTLEIRNLKLYNNKKKGVYEHSRNDFVSP